MLRSFILFLAGSFVALSSSAEEVRYTGIGFRDPFAGQAVSRTADQGSRGDEQLKAMTIQGILLSGRDSRVIVDDRIYRVGSALGGGKVSRIEDDGIVLSVSGKEIVIKQKKRKTSHDISKRSQ